MKIVLIAVVFVWCGLVLGISFVATPLKFMAPNITLELGLGIGRVVFGFFNRVEILLAVVTTVMLWFIKPRRMLLAVLIAPVVIVVVQTFVLLPILEQRLDMILNGNPPSESYHHIVYIVMEVTKALALVLGGTLFTRDQL